MGAKSENCTSICGSGGEKTLIISHSRTWEGRA